MSPDHGTPGNGLLLFIRVDDFNLALQRECSLVRRLEEEPHVNPNTQTKEFSLAGSGRILSTYQIQMQHFRAATSGFLAILKSPSSAGRQITIRSSINSWRNAV
jgi:hypothetical protein